MPRRFGPVGAPERGSVPGAAPKWLVAVAVEVHEVPDGGNRSRGGDAAGAPEGYDHDRGDRGREPERPAGLPPGPQRDGAGGAAEPERGRGRAAGSARPGTRPNRTTAAPIAENTGRRPRTHATTITGTSSKWSASHWRASSRASSPARVCSTRRYTDQPWRYATRELVADVGIAHHHELAAPALAGGGPAGQLEQGEQRWRRRSGRGAGGGSAPAPA